MIFSRRAVLTRSASAGLITLLPLSACREQSSKKSRPTSQSAEIQNHNGSVRYVLNSIEDLRHYSGPHKTLEINYHTTPHDNGGGLFIYDPKLKAKDNNGIIIAHASGKGCWRRHISHDVTLAMFGAQGDESDETDIIQNALNNLAGYKLHLNKGAFYARNLVINVDMMIEGAGYSLSALVQFPGATGDFITIEDVKHPSFRHMQISGNAKGGSAVCISGSDLNKTSGIEFFKVLITNAGKDGIEFKGSSDNTVISETIIEENGRHGVNITPRAAGVSIHQCRFVNNVETGANIVGTSNAVEVANRVTNNVFGGGKNGVIVSNRFFTIITDNEFLILKNEAIKLEGASYTSVSNNQIHSNGGGILECPSTIEPITNPRSNTITHNTIFLNGFGFIGKNTQSTSLISNSIELNSKDGITITDTVSTTLLDNEVYGNWVNHPATSPRIQAGITIIATEPGLSLDNKISLGRVNDGGVGGQKDGIFIDKNVRGTIIENVSISAPNRAIVQPAGTVLHISGVNDL